jgi:hypothetical protein
MFFNDLSGIYRSTLGAPVCMTGTNWGQVPFIGNQTPFLINQTPYWGSQVPFTGGLPFNVLNQVPYNVVGSQINPFAGNVPFTSPILAHSGLNSAIQGHGYSPLMYGQWNNPLGFYPVACR